MRTRWRTVAVVAMAVLAGCGGGHPQASSTPTTRAATTTTTPPTTNATPPTTSAPPATTTPTTAAPAPTLGTLAGTFVHGAGFGQVEPAAMSNGGDPTGAVGSITWSSWGGPQAVGTGRSDYVGPNQSVASGTMEAVRIVAFDLGTCNGRYMYAAVEWYFAQHGQTFDPNRFEDVCTGSYYPLQDGPYQDGGAGGTAHYVLRLTGAPASLTGSIGEVSAGGTASPPLFSFHGQAGMDGSLTLVSNGPYQPGHTFTGTWQTLGLTLTHCSSYLRSAATANPSCSFDWS